MINKNHNRGFTLIETLVAIFILTTAIAGPLTIASRALTSALVAKNQITAFYLAQDAVEYVRFARDTNTLAGGDWLTGAGATGTFINLTSCISTAGCYLDSTAQNPPVITACTTCAMPISNPEFTGRKYLYYNNANGYYSYNSASPANTKTIFWRQISITSISTTEVKLTVTVYWSDAAAGTTVGVVSSVIRQVVVIENLLKWQ